VLFPGTPLQLHIFEERYKRMVNLCIEERRPFGVVLIDQGVEALGPLAEPHSVGCTAQIIHVQRLEKGRMNIVALGGERFRVLSLDREAQPYLVGVVEEYPLPQDSPEVLVGEAARLRQQVERYIEMLLEAGDAQFDLRNLPDDPLTLAYMAAALVQVSPLKKQEMLASQRVEDLLARLRVAYQREVVLMQVALRPSVGEGPGGFSLN
jgi:Lon protease-like protein